MTTIYEQTQEWLKISEAECEKLTAENARLSLENQSLREKIIAAGYMSNHDTEEIRRSNDALKELMKYRLSEAVEMMAENERLTAALVECREAKALETAKPDVCDNCDRPAYQYWIDGTRYCREHQINLDSLEMERGQ